MFKKRKEQDNITVSSPEILLNDEDVKEMTASLKFLSGRYSFSFFSFSLSHL